MQTQRFKTPLAEHIFRNKYANGPDDSWDSLCDRVIEDVCGTRWGTDRALMSEGDRNQLSQYMKEMKFIPGGRYLYYAGRPAHFWNNCFIGIAQEDTREEWAKLSHWAMSCLTTGGGIGIDYSRIRPSGKVLSRTGGMSSGPLPLMSAINEIGRSVMQGGSRRSAIYASLNWRHEDIPLYLEAKNWSADVKELKSRDFNFPATLDMTNISINYDDAWLRDSQNRVSTRLQQNPIFLENCRQAMQTGEPGFSFNFGDKQNETGRNASIGCLH